MSDFGKALRQLRLGKKLSQAELAEYIGVSKSSINMYERGEREPGFETIEAIADFFNVDMNHLLGYEQLKMNLLEDRINSDDQLENIYFNFAKEAQDDRIGPRRYPPCTGHN